MKRIRRKTAVGMEPTGRSLQEIRGSFEERFIYEKEEGRYVHMHFSSVWSTHPPRPDVHEGHMNTQECTDGATAVELSPMQWLYNPIISLQP